MRESIRRLWEEVPQVPRRLFHVKPQPGWMCHCGEYKQDWAHDFMLEVELPKFPWGKV